MKVIFKVIQSGSGNDVYFKRLSKALKKVNIDSKIEFYPKFFQFFPVFLFFFNKKSPGDVIHSNIEYGWIFKEKNKPLYVTIHHNVFDKEYQKYTSFTQKLFHQFILKWNIKMSLSVANKIIAVSNYTKKSFKNTFGKCDIETIYNSVDIKKYKPIKIKSRDKRFKLLFVGNLTKRKGADLLPRIMNQLTNSYVLYFTSGLRAKIPREFNLPNMVSLGRISEAELIRQYNKCDALLFPTRLEGFGYAITEAMACGKPIIASNNSSIPEIIRDGENGFLCKSDNVTEFANTIRIVKSSKKVIKKIKNVNLDKIKKIFSATVVVKQYEKIYS